MSHMPLVAIIPMAGVSARLAPIPSSKELLPIGLVETPNGLRPKPVCLYLLEALRLAGVERAFLVLRPGKWDIPTYLGHGASVGIDLAYLLMNLPYGSPYTVDQAYPFVQACLVAFGFPDVIFSPPDAIAQLVAQQRISGADVVLGLFPTDQPQHVDMVAFDPDGRVRRIEIKQPQSQLPYTWMLAVWTPTFSAFMHRYLAEDAQRRADPDPAKRPLRELFVGDVIQAALDRGMHVEAHCFPEGHALDVGTPANLIAAMRQYV
ncbi:MAG: sugar phosphate nucleotidyltransferase [Oscillochloridaceae bacterium umkhey_bin13]